jgi:hypothetical protein
MKPIWTYGAKIWGCASKSNISIIQRSQSKILRTIANAPWYVLNITLLEDLNVPLVQEVTKQRSTRYHSKRGHSTVTRTTQRKKTKKELANRPKRRIIRTYWWISLFMSYRNRSN